MPLRDFQCMKCGNTLVDIVLTKELTADKYAKHRPCPKCGGHLTALPPKGTSFVIRGGK